MDVLTMIIALIGAATGSVALVWQILNDSRRVKVIFLGSRLLLINHSHRPANIDSVGFIDKDGVSCSFIEPKFVSLLTIPAEDQIDYDTGSLKWAIDAKYAFARDVCGKTFKTKIKKEEVDFYLEQEKKLNTNNSLS